MREQLLALAARDAELLHARHLVAHPPSLAELQALDATLESLRARKRSLDAERAPLAERSASLERDAAAARDRAGVLDARLRTATGASRDLEAMSHEADAQRARATAIDDELLEVLEPLEPLEQEDAALRVEFGERRAQRDAVAARVEEERAHARADVEALDAGRPELAAALEGPMLARYDAAAARAGGVGAAQLIDGRCSGCRVAIPTAVVDRLLRGSDDELVVVCDECGRLLVR
jgi:predicted  nucleic acid-binding Zn-ribbon protein